MCRHNTDFSYLNSFYGYLSSAISITRLCHFRDVFRQLVCVERYRSNLSHSARGMEFDILSLALLALRLVTQEGGFKW